MFFRSWYQENVSFRPSNERYGPTMLRTGQRKRAETSQIHRLLGQTKNHPTTLQPLHDRLDLHVRLPIQSVRNTLQSQSESIHRRLQPIRLQRLQPRTNPITQFIFHHAESELQNPSNQFQEAFTRFAQSLAKTSSYALADVVRPLQHVSVWKSRVVVACHSFVDDH